MIELLDSVAFDGHSLVTVILVWPVSWLIIAGLNSLMAKRAGR